MRRVKGFSIVGVIIIIAAVAVVAAVIFFFGKGGFGFGGGKGDGEGDGVTEAVQADATVQEEQMTTLEIVYIEVTVSESKYIFNNRSYDMEDIDTLVDDIASSGGSFTVRITDEYASEKAYEKLVSALRGRKISFMYIKDGDAGTERGV